MSNKTKQIITIICIVIVFFGLYYFMNRNYSALSRYPYADENQKDIIAKHLSDKEIDYIIEYYIPADDFLKFINAPGFSIYHLASYQTVKNQIWQLSDREAVIVAELMLDKQMIPEESCYEYQEMNFEQIREILK